MPAYIVKSPDGRTFEVNAPDGATQDQVLAYAKRHFEGLDAKKRADDADMKRMADPTAGMSNFEKFAAGAGKAMVDTGRGLGQMLRLVSREDVAESRKRDTPLMNTGAGMAGNIVGNVAVNAPLALVPGANTIRGGALIGAASGLIQPSASTEETLKNTVIGGAAGAAVPALVTAGKVAKSFVDPFYEGGRNKIIGRALRESAGNQVDDAVRNLQTVKSAVPGVQYTAAEAAKNPGIAAMQRTATAIDPVAMNESAARQAANNSARVSALEEMAGTAGDRAALSELRAGTAEDLYRQAYGQPINLARDAATGQFLTKAQQAARQGEITKLMRTPAMQQAAERAKQMMLNDPNLYGKANSATGSVQGMDYMRRALGDMIKEASPNEQRILIGLRDRLDTTLQSISPKYIEAKNVFAEMSKPINEMDIVQSIVDHAVNKATGNLTPAAYARALQDKTAQSVTGMRTATLEKSMTPQNMATLNAIKDDMTAQLVAQNAGRGVGSDTVQKLAFSNMLDQAGLPTFIRNFGPAGAVGNVMQRAAQVAYSDANKRMSEQLARALLNPNETADLMVGAMVNPKLQALVNGLKRGGVAIGSSVPALIQAQQQ